MRQEDLDIIILNLLSNAVKYTDHGGSIRVSSITEKRKGISITVSDTGIGIPKEYLSSIFMRYICIPENTSLSGAQGTGLGLPLVKEIVEAYEGTVSIESVIGKGSTVTVRFSSSIITHEDESKTYAEIIQKQETSDLYTAELYSELQDINPCSPDVRTSLIDAPQILIVEDHPDMCHYLESILSQTYRILTAANGEEALVVLDHQHIDLILSDIINAAHGRTAASSGGDFSISGRHDTFYLSHCKRFD